MNIDLIPCPECCSPAEIKHFLFHGTSQPYSYVHCTNPACHLFSHNPHFTGHSLEENDENAALSWNERYADTEPCKVSDAVVQDAKGATSKGATSFFGLRI
jgi:hypothetical protein